MSNIVLKRWKRTEGVVNESYTHSDGHHDQSTQLSEVTLTGHLGREAQSPIEMTKSAGEAASNGGDDSHLPNTLTEDNRNEGEAGGGVSPCCNWSWMVVLGATLLMLLTNIISSCFGIIFSPFLLQLHTSSTTITIIYSVLQFMWNSSGLFVGPLVEEFNWRKVAMVSSFLSSCSFILSAFATSPWQLLLSFSILGGFCYGLMTSLSYLIIPHYFTRWRGVANACVVAGIGIGQMIGPILVEFLQKEYGYVGGTLLMGAVLFHACIGASLLRPIQNQTITNTSVQLVEPESRTSGVVTAEKKWTTVAIRIFLCVCRNIVTNFSVLKSRRAVIIAIGGLLTFNSWLNFIALIPFAVQAAGHPLQAASTCVIVSAVCNLVTCLAVSMLSDWSKFSMKGACMTSTAVIAASTFAFSVVTDIWWQKIIMGMWGCGVGSYMGIYGLTIAYYMGVHSLDATLGVTQLLIGLGFITIGPIIGVIRDASDSYTFSIWVLAGLAACSFILWIFMPNTTQHSHTTPLSPIP